MDLELHGPEIESRLAPKAEAPTGDALSSPRAEVISRLWTAIAYLEEVRGDLGKHVRKSAAREKASGTLQEATAALVRVALLLTPAAIVESIPQVVGPARRRKDGGETAAD